MAHLSAMRSPIPGPRLIRALVVLCLCLMVAGCIPAPAVERRAPVPGSTPPAAVTPVETPQSAAARAYYAEVQAVLLKQGLMRTDGGGDDTFVSERMLAENFLRIALYDEYVRGPAGPVRREQASILRRWAAPVRVALRFGASVPTARREADTARIASYLSRLSRVTGHPIALSETAPNFFVHVVSEDEREALGPALAASLPGLGPRDIQGITRMPRSTYCLVYATSEGATGVYTRAFAVIRSEHPDLLRLSCFHEELAQGLGLPNDSGRARPSIFNDDEEFALLTGQDELMLRMLYDPALRPGMTEAEARPVVEALAARYLGGDS
jgi:hypothetical protein